MSDGTKERVITDYGQSDLKIELLDYIIFSARTKYNTHLSKDVEGFNGGKILLHWTITDFGNLLIQNDSILRIFFYDIEGELIHEAVLTKGTYIGSPTINTVMDKYNHFIMEAIGQS